MDSAQHRHDLVRELVAALHEDPHGIEPSVLQQLLAAVVTAYAARRGDGDPLPPFPTAVGPTPLEQDVLEPDASSVCLTVSAMLNAVSVELFELAMWQAWTGTASGAEAP